MSCRRLCPRGPASAGEIAGIVRISASEIVAVEVLPPILANHLVPGLPDYIGGR